MKKLALLLMAALALPVMAQYRAETKAESMRSKDRDKMEVLTPVKAFDAKAVTVADKNRGGYLWDFETDESLEGWLTYDADGDGYSWEIDDYYSYNGGTYSLTSRSYYGGALSPDNWLISPTVPLDGILSIFAENYWTAYPDKFMVYVFVGELTDVSDFDYFVPISEFITPGADWEEHTFDLSEYEGAMGCFAIRHYDCTDQYRILVDYISLGYTPNPVATTPEELSVEPTSTTGSAIWTDNDDTNWNLRYRVYTEPTGQLWDFEEEAAYDYSLPGGWTCIDADGDGYEWYHLNQSGGFQTHSGYGHLTSASYANYTGLYPDNWLISPETTLTGNLSFWACGQDPSYSNECFAVYVTTGDPNDLSSYVALEENIVANGYMTEYVFDLSEYEGMTGHIAIRHYNTYDQFRLNVDDVQIGTISEEAEWIYVYGLTDTNYFIEGLDPNTTYEVQVQATNDNGKTSDWTESTLFTTKTQTSIDELVVPVKSDNRYYNMMGQEVDGNNLPAGIYIHNGKKILVK